MNWLSDTRAILIRNLIRHSRTPEVIAFGIAQPVMFVLLFSQVLGGAIDVPGTNYTNYLMAGIFAQTAIFGATFSGFATAEDKRSGIIDRFKVMPIARSAIVAGRTLADLAINATSLTIMSLAGLAVGWRWEDGFLNFLGGMGLLMLFSWAFSWFMSFIGMLVRSPEALNGAVMIMVFPLTFISNGFVPSGSLPRPLEIFANYNPVSAIVQGARSLFGNTGSIPVPDIWTMQHPVLFVLISAALIIMIFGPLAARQVGRSD